MSMMQAAKLEIDEEVDARVEDGEIILKPIKRRGKFTLQELLNGITPENLHESVSTGKPVGKEVW